MIRWMTILLVGSIIANLILAVLVYRLWQHRKNAILAWAATEEWVGQQNRNKTPAPAEPNSHKIVLLGASITQAFNPDDYFTENPFINKGINGQYSGQYLLRFKKDIIDYHPRAVIIKLCAIHVTRDIPLQISYDNIEMMTQLAQVNDIQPVLASMIPVTRTFDQNRSPKDITREIKEFNQWVESYCERNQLVYLDYFGVLADESGYLKPQYSTDGMHLNSKGYDLFATKLESMLSTLGEHD